MLKRIIGIAMMFLLVGCATLLQSNEQPVTFASNPSGATVYLDGVALAEPTPVTLTLNPKQAYRARFEKNGLRSCEEVLPRLETMEMTGSLAYPVRKYPATIHRALQPVSCR